LKSSIGFRSRWRWQGYAFALPAFVVIALFIIYPLCVNFRYCFTNYDGINPNARFVGLTNFENIFNDPNFTLVISNTLFLVVAYVLVLNTLAILMAVVATKAARRFANFYKSVVYTPCLLSMVVIGFIWRLLYDYNNGLINEGLRAVGLNGLVNDWLGNISIILPSISMVVIWYALGYYMVIYFAGLMAIPVELHEVSRVDGANFWKELRHVTLPQLAPSITINVVLTTMLMLGSFDLPYTLTNGGGPGYYGTTLAVWVYRFAYDTMQMSKSFAAAVVLAVIAIGITSVELFFLLRNERRMS